MSGEDLSSNNICTNQPQPRPARRNRIGPLQERELTEIRPGRWLKVLHIRAGSGGGDYGSSKGDERQDQSTACLTVKGNKTCMLSGEGNVEKNNTDPSISRTGRDSDVNSAQGKSECRGTSHQERVPVPLAKTEELTETSDKQGTPVTHPSDTKDFGEQEKDDIDKPRDEFKSKDVSTSSNNLSAHSQSEQGYQGNTANSNHNDVHNESGELSHGCTTKSARSVSHQATNGCDKLNPPEKNLDLPSSTETHNINHSNSNVNDSGTMKDKCKLETFYDKTRSRTVPNRLHKEKETRWASEDDVPPADTVLFFLHGVGGSSEVWTAQINYFAAKGYQIVAPDLLGHGQSSAPEMGSAYHFQELANDITAIFERYSGKKNVVIGHSYGCTFCTLLAHEQGPRMSRLVMVSGGAPSPLEPQPCHIFCLPVCLLDCISPMLVKCFLRRAFNTQDQLSTVEDMHKSFNVPAHVLRGTMVGQVWHEGDEVYHTEIEVPTLLIHGRQDGLVPLQDEYGMAEALPHCRLEVIEDVSHMVMMECPDRVNQLIHDFILQDSEELFSQKHVNRSPSRASLRSTSKAIPAHLLTS